MFYRIVVFFLLFSAGFSAHCQIGIITYHTPFEQEVFENPGSSYVNMFMAIGKQADEAKAKDAEQKIRAFIQEVQRSKILNYSEVKKINALHKLVHERFLTDYKLDAQFQEIFVTGKYNCVSATALFAIVLEELEIPYYIQEKPSHVFIMAYPSSKSISVEMTAKRDASWLPERKDVYQSVAILLEYGMTTEQEIKRLGENAVYNNYYNINKQIDIEDLAGIQYMNQSSEYVRDKEYKEALNAICKAEKWYKGQAIQGMKAELLYWSIAEGSFENLEQIKQLLLYAEMPKADENRVYYYYVNFLQEYVVTGNQPLLADSCIQLVRQSKIKLKLKNKIIGLTYLGLAELYSNTFEPSKQLESAEKAYEFQPDDPLIQKTLIQSILSRFTKEDDTDIELLMSKLDEYRVKTPKIIHHNMFQVAQLLVYSQMSMIAFSNNDGEEGQKYFDLAMQLYLSIGDKSSVQKDSFGWMFAEKGAYLYRKHQYQEALEVLEDGLRYVPKHERILARIEIVKEKLK